MNNSLICCKIVFWKIWNSADLNCTCAISLLRLRTLVMRTWIWLWLRTRLTLTLTLTTVISPLLLTATRTCSLHISSTWWRLSWARAATSRLRAWWSTTWTLIWTLIIIRSLSSLLRNISRRFSRVIVLDTCHIEWSSSIWELFSRS